jgi:hypothetical protein
MRDQYDGEPLSSLGKEIAQTFADAGTPKSEPDSALPYNPFSSFLYSNTGDTHHHSISD